MGLSCLNVSGNQFSLRQEVNKRYPVFHQSSDDFSMMVEDFESENSTFGGQREYSLTLFNVV